MDDEIIHSEATLSAVVHDAVANTKVQTHKSRGARALLCAHTKIDFPC